MLRIDHEKSNPIFGDGARCQIGLAHAPSRTAWGFLAAICKSVQAAPDVGCVIRVRELRISTNKLTEQRRALLWILTLISIGFAFVEKRTLAVRKVAGTLVASAPPGLGSISAFPSGRRK
jgi:hypothetical protein